MSETTRLLLVDHAKWASFFDELNQESDRGAALLTAAWINHLLERKLAKLFSGENAKARAQLVNFSQRINAAFGEGRLDDDVCHDLHVIRKIRNKFAHHIHGLSMESPEIRTLIESFQVPHREFYDWGKLKCAATGEGNGIVFYTDRSPENVGESLVIPAAFIFRWASSWAIAYLSANLGVGVVVPDEFQFNDPEDL
jgi:hypothetical protein